MTMRQVDDWVLYRGRLFTNWSHYVAPASRRSRGSLGFVSRPLSATFSPNRATTKYIARDVSPGLTACLCLRVPEGRHEGIGVAQGFSPAGSRWVLVAALAAEVHQALLHPVNCYRNSHPHPSQPGFRWGTHTCVCSNGLGGPPASEHTGSSPRSRRQILAQRVSAG